MADEWKKVELYGQNNDGDPRRYTCAAGVKIEKNTLLMLTDPRTASAHDGTVSAAIAGISTMEKSATDGSTSISCWTNGIFEAVASGSITLGSTFKASTTANQIEAAANTNLGCTVGGYVLETTTDGDTVNVRLRL